MSLMKKLPNWCLTNPSPAFYETESGTVIEQTAKVYGAMNELIEATNEFSEDTTKEITTFKSDVTKHIKEQDDDIQNQKDNVIPERITNEVQTQIDNGTFDRQIEEHIGNLEDRMNNLLGSIPEGGTSMDAEVVDIRSGLTPGEAYKTAGEAVRAKANLNQINRFLDNDIFNSQGKNIFPYHASRFNYPLDTSSPYNLVGGQFPIAAGDYRLIITDVSTNLIFMNHHITEGTDGTRILTINAPKPGVYSFTIPEDGQCMIYYGSSISNPVEGEHYLGNVYIYSADVNLKIPNELIEAALILSDEVKENKGENLYTADALSIRHDGTSLNVLIPLYIELQAGNYMMRFREVTPKLMIKCSTTDERVFYQDVLPDTWYKFTAPESTVYGFYFYVATGYESLGEAGVYTVSGGLLYPDNGKPFIPGYLTGYDELVKIIGEKEKESEQFTSVSGNIGVNESLTITQEEHIKKNNSIMFNGNFSTFGGLRTGHGKTHYGATYLEITSTTIYVYNYYQSASLVKSADHGLTLSDFINVNVNVGEGVANIIINTSTGSFTLENVNWSGCNGNVYAESLGGVFTDCLLKWTCADLNKKVWIFGDSYMGMSDSRIIGQLFKRGYKNFLVSGFPGGGSSNELVSLKTLLTMGTPKTIVWCLGMNNGDSGAVNASWNSVLKEVQALCNDYDITLILATIPSCPKIDNTYKNEVVRNSGYRYIDFNKAVGVNGTAWYEGMLDSDEVHPTALGASVLVGRMLVDAPEIAAS